MEAASDCPWQKRSSKSMEGGSSPRASMRPEVFSRFNFLSAINEVTTLEKILIVEDQENILMGLEDDLSLEGYEIRTAKDGLDALGLASSEHFNLILLDIMLPRMNGFSILKQLRK